MTVSAKTVRVVVGLLGMGAFSVASWAHKPSYANNHTDADSAFEVVDPEISIVLYSEMTCSSQELWLHFDSTGFEQVWLELGVPALDRLEDYRPSLAIVAEGLTSTDVPFDLPDGMGALVIDTQDVGTAIDFSEPFTQTDSWILFRDWFDVPPDTDVYLVAYNPEEWTGKLWVAVGLIEDFSDVDLSQFPQWLEKTQAFHEIGDTEEHYEVDCAEVYEEEAQPRERPEAQAQSETSGDGGCMVLPSSVDNRWNWGLVMALFALCRRRVS